MVKCCCDLKALCLNSDGNSVWWLIGVPWIPSAILSAIRCVHYGQGNDPDFASEADALQAILPGGMEIVGALLVQPSPSASESIQTAKRLRMHLKGMSIQLIGATGSIETGEIKLYTESLSEIQETEANNQELWETTYILHANLDLSVPMLTNSFGDHHMKLEASFNEFSKTSLMSSRAAFLVESASKKAVVKAGAAESPLLSEAFPAATRKHETVMPTLLNVRILMQQCTNDEIVFAPMLHYTPAVGGMLHQDLNVNLDVLCLVAANATLSKATAQLQRSLSSQLDCFRKMLVGKGARSQLQAFHFIVPGFIHPVTAIYDMSQSESDVELVNVRKSLHVRLRLPLDRPLVRTPNALTIKGSEIVSAQSEGGRRLINVHSGISRCGVPGGEMSVIQGSYEYYHYLQDRCDDNGWGCAYRSLQTIVSWFKLQHYTSVPVPSHKEIQQTLVDIGDKEPSFVGSREWIGAIELSFVLDKLLGVTSKILNVRSGADLPEKCRELAAHFDTQGTPVMIGGGVLAYTLLGVDYNELTGESAFLILDPHYTGGEDLKAIRNGGWCGWKKAVTDSGQEFFLRNKFYNLLLPQRPQTV